MYILDTFIKNDAIIGVSTCMLWYERPQIVAFKFIVYTTGGPVEIRTEGVSAQNQPKINELSDQLKVARQQVLDLLMDSQAD